MPPSISERNLIISVIIALIIICLLLFLRTIDISSSSKSSSSSSLNDKKSLSKTAAIIMRQLPFVTTEFLEQQTVEMRRCSDEFFERRQQHQTWLQPQLIWDHTMSKSKIAASSNRSKSDSNNDDDSLLSIAACSHHLFPPSSPSDSSSKHSSNIGNTDDHHQNHLFHDELVCTHPKQLRLREAENNKYSETRALLARYREQYSSLKDILEQEKSRYIVSPKAVADGITGLDFQLLTSWLFKQQHLPPTIGNDQSHTKFEFPGDSYFRSFHDSNSENIFRLENFCVHPLTGLSGIIDTSSSKKGEGFSKPAKYLGKDDTHGLYHGELGLQRFLGKVRNIKPSSPPEQIIKEYDTNQFEGGKGWRNRLAVFHYVAPLSRNNLYHTFHRYLSLLGIMDNHIAKVGKFGKKKSEEFKDLIHMLKIFEEDEDIEDIEAREKARYDYDYRVLYEEPTSKKGLSVQQKPLLILVVDVTMNDHEQGFLHNQREQQQQLKDDEEEEKQKINKNDKQKKRRQQQKKKAFDHDDDDHVPALGLLLNSLNLPWIAVLADGNMPQNQNYMFKQMEKHYLFPSSNSNETSSSTQSTTNYFQSKYFAASSSSSSRNSRLQAFRDSPNAKMCFKNGIAYQNCFHCSREHITGEVESYSFGMWNKASESRKTILNLHRGLMKRCLMTPSVFQKREAKRLKYEQGKDWHYQQRDNKNNKNKNTNSNKGNSNNNNQKEEEDNTIKHQTIMTPKVFFDLRSTTRSIFDFPLFAQQLLLKQQQQRENNNNNNNNNDNLIINFGELWKEPSYNSYLVDKLLDADIFIGVHGSAFSQVPLMKLLSPPSGGRNNNNEDEEKEKEDSSSSGKFKLSAKQQPVIVIEFTSHLHFCFRKYFGPSSSSAGGTENTNTDNNENQENSHEKTYKADDDHLDKGGDQNEGDRDFRKRFRSCWFGSYTANEDINDIPSSPVMESISHNNKNNKHKNNNNVKYEHWIIQFNVAESLFELESTFKTFSDDTPIPHSLYRKALQSAYFIPPNILDMIISEAQTRWKQLVSDENDSTTNSSSSKNRSPSFFKTSPLFSPTRVSDLGDGKYLAQIHFDKFYNTETVVSIIKMVTSTYHTYSQKYDLPFIEKQFVPFLNGKLRPRFEVLKELSAKDVGINYYLETPIRFSSPAIETWKRIAQHLLAVDDANLKLMIKNRVLQFKYVDEDEVVSSKTDVANVEKETERVFCFMENQNLCVKLKVSWY